MGTALKASREQVLASLPDPISDESQDEFRKLVEARASGMPVSYVTGTREFYGRTYRVGPVVLIPRPETELLVDLCLLEIDAHRPANVHDACTGSGCVAITIALERPESTVSASDLSGEALTIARRNASALDAQVEFTQSNLLDRVEQNAPFDILTANPPYLTDNEYKRLASADWPEPQLALAGGEDGLGVVRRLISDAIDRIATGGRILVEIGADQAERAQGIMAEAGFKEIEKHRDLAGHDRVVSGRRW